MRASIIIFSQNNANHLPQLIDRIKKQKTDLKTDFRVHSTNVKNSQLLKDLLPSSQIINCSGKMISPGHIKNAAIENCNGDFLVFINDHCLPTNDLWLDNLILPMRLFKNIGYTYGRQLSSDTSCFSELRQFTRQYPAKCQLPQKGYYCNNQNAAIKRDIWRSFRFNEILPALEDFDLGKRLTENGIEIGYVSDAVIKHQSSPNSLEILNQYRNEARALNTILGREKLSLLNFAKSAAGSILTDSCHAIKQRNTKGLLRVLRYRLLQFRGSHIGISDVDRGYISR